MSQQLYAIIAHDNPGAEEARSQYRDGHLDHFRSIADFIAVAGPMFDDGGNSAGSLIIVKAENSVAARSLIKADPFYSQKVWSEIEIKSFKAASGDWSDRI